MKENFLRAPVFHPRSFSFLSDRRLRTPLVFSTTGFFESFECGEFAPPGFLAAELIS
jgi:hypothetical protein